MGKEVGRRSVLTRRDFLGSATTAAVLGGLMRETIPSLLRAETSTQSARNNRRPNILFIHADDVGRELLGCYGGQSYATPNLDRLAAKGTRFETCYATPVCSPTRVQLLTGRYSFRNYTQWRYLDPKETTFAQLLKRAGYRTAIAGKWQLDGWDRTPQGIQEAGFDEYFSCHEEKVHPLSRQGKGNVFWGTPTLWKNGRRIEADDQHSEDRFSDFIIDFMKRNKDRSFMAFYNMNLCHRPFVPTPHSQEIKEGAALEPFMKFEGYLKYFSDMVSYMDTLVGRLVAALEELGLRENTYVFFTADNGTDNVWEAANLRSKFLGRNVEGGKYTVSDLGVNVPFIASLPGGISEGRVCSEVIDFTDMLPTFMDIAGCRLPENLSTDGHSFLPLLKGRDYIPRKWVYSWGGFIKTSRRFQNPKQYKNEHLHVLRNKRWKYYSDGRLFDMQTDPFEESPVLPGVSAEADHARTLLATELAQLRSTGTVLW